MRDAAETQARSTLPFMSETAGDGIEVPPEVSWVETTEVRKGGNGEVDRER